MLNRCFKSPHPKPNLLSCLPNQHPILQDPSSQWKFPNLPCQPLITNMSPQLPLWTKLFFSWPLPLSYFSPYFLDQKLPSHECFFLIVYTNYIVNFLTNKHHPITYLRICSWILLPILKLAFEKYSAEFKGLFCFVTGYHIAQASIQLCSSRVA